MKKLKILHLGIGNVGRSLVEQILEQQKFIEKNYSVQFVYCGLFTTKGGIFNKEGFTSSSLPTLLQQIQKDLVQEKQNVADIILHMPSPFVLIDTTASDKTIPLLECALQKGDFVAMSNKKPIANSQKLFNRLHKISGQRLFYETTVGAGLPVIQTLNALLATGDDIIKIQGCMSGTLGFVFSQLETGATFTQAVMEAKTKGFTEPDPRDDLSGIDVARKALILARLIGQKIELSDIQLESLYAKDMDKLTVELFLQQLSKLDKSYKEEIKIAKKAKKVLRYVATITKKTCKVGLEMVDENSELGSLQGRNNLIMFQTKRYFDNPLTVKGHGAGAEVTAAGVFGDLLSIAKMI